MKVWSTKYALTRGIHEVEGEVSTSAPEMFCQEKQPGTFRDFIHKPYWHETRETAVGHAKALAHRKIISLEKQITKIKKIQWD